MEQKVFQSLVLVALGLLFLAAARCTVASTGQNGPANYFRLAALGAGIGLTTTGIVYLLAALPGCFRLRGYRTTGSCAQSVVRHRFSAKARGRGRGQSWGGPRSALSNVLE